MVSPDGSDEVAATPAFPQNDATRAFPQLAHLEALDDDQRAEVLKDVLSQLRERLDGITER